MATYNIKGGVGKTAAAVNLAYLAARDGHRTLLWDLDPQGAASYLLRIRPRVKGGGKALIRGKTSLDQAVKPTEFDRLDLVPADFTYRNLDLLLDAAKKPTQRIARLLGPLAGDYDLAILDCPPGISLVSENVVHAAGILLVPLIPTTLSVRTLEQLTGFVAELDHPPVLFPFFTMVDGRKRLHREVIDDLRARRGDLADTAIPALSLVEQMAVHRAPLPVFAPRSRVTRSYQDLWAEVRDRGACPGLTGDAGVAGGLEAGQGRRVAVRLGLQLALEGGQPLQLGLDGRLEPAVDLQRLGHDGPLGGPVVLGVVGGPQGAEAVLGGQDGPDLVEVEPEQVLELADAGQAGQVLLGVAAGAARAVGRRGEQPQLLVVAQGPDRHRGPLRRLPDAQPTRHAGCSSRAAAVPGASSSSWT
jgi:chromosome partitioning protein